VLVAAAARSQVMEHVTGANIGVVLHEQVQADAVLMTDTLPVYRKPGKDFAAHETVNHVEDEYVRETPNGKAHINTAEGFFSQLKRSIDGTHPMFRPITCTDIWQSLTTATTHARSRMGSAPSKQFARQPESVCGIASQLARHRKPRACEK